MDIQATAVSYKKHAILIQGPSGIGKTSLALQLIERGAFLIGDDVVELFIKN
ncbi:MAG: serine kinase, partial [Alphaproteobacteria bacterium]|nr:serine kinase [Alphaproteobacteria bacterium]